MKNHSLFLILFAALAGCTSPPADTTHEIDDNEAISVILTEGENGDITASGSNAPWVIYADRVETWLIGYHIEAAWGASDRTGSIMVTTDALSLTEAEFGNTTPDRLYNDVVAALSKIGVSIRPGKDTLYILSFSKPINRSLVVETPRPQKPKK